jgi:hypothetical protein
VSVSSLCGDSTDYPHNFATISGGSGNQVSANSSSVSGGEYNIASDQLVERRRRL